MKKKLRGSLTVFFTLLFSLILMFLLALFAFGRNRLMRSGVRQDLDFAAQSTMAEYDAEWVEEYGLYMLPQSSLEKTCRFYLEANASHAYGSYRVEDLSCQTTGTLADPDLLEQEIAMFMKERALPDSLQEMADLLDQLNETGEKGEELKTYENSAQMEEVQLLYARLVTDLTGLQEDGRYAMYAINTFLTHEVTLDQLEKAARLERPGEPFPEGDEGYSEEERTSALEAYTQAMASYEQQEQEALEDVQYTREEVSAVLSLLNDARGTAGTLAGLLESIPDQAELVPVSAEDLHFYEDVWEQNAILLENVREPLGNLMAVIGSTGEEGTSLRQEALTQIRRLKAYRADISLPYEYREPRPSMDLKELLHYLKGYSVDVEELAPDQEVDLHLEGRTAQGEEEETPSPGNFFDFSFEIPDAQDLKNRWYTIEYSLGEFRNFRETAAEKEGESPLDLRGNPKEKHVLANEVEYLIVGRSNEYKNVNGTRNRLLAMRMSLNALFLLSDADKRALIQSAASATGGILLPGIGDSVAFGLILTAWSFAESIHDLQILYRGGCVPFFKDGESWQTDLGSLTESAVSDREVSQTKGLSYRQYLRVLLCLISRDTRLSRIQDLLYVNHAYYPLDQAVVSFSASGVAAGETKLRFSGEYAYVP